MMNHHPRTPRCAPSFRAHARESAVQTSGVGRSGAPGLREKGSLLRGGPSAHRLLLEVNTHRCRLLPAFLVWSPRRLQRRRHFRRQGGWTSGTEGRLQFAFGLDSSQETLPPGSQVDVLISGPGADGPIDNRSLGRQRRGDLRRAAILHVHRRARRPLHNPLDHAEARVRANQGEGLRKPRQRVHSLRGRHRARRAGLGGDSPRQSAGESPRVSSNDTGK